MCSLSLALSLSLRPLSNQAEIARLLLSKGANVNLLNNSLCTALHIAVNKGFTDMVRVLTEHSADVNLQVRRPDGTLADVCLYINIYVGCKSDPDCCCSCSKSFAFLFLKLCMDFSKHTLLKCKSDTIPDRRQI